MVKPNNKTFALSVRKRGQEEMVGFALIVIIVAVILIIFLGISLSKKNSTSTESYVAENFVQAMLQYTTSCQGNFGNVQVRDLVFYCIDGQSCTDGKDSCQILNSTLNGLITQGWNTGEGSFVKGYELSINSTKGNIISLKGGNTTNSAQGAYQSFSKGADTADIRFTAYN